MSPGTRSLTGACTKDAITQHPNEGHGKRLQASQSLLGLALLVDAEAGVEDQD